MKTVSNRENSPSERVKVKRSAGRARYGRNDVLEILSGGLITHVGVNTPSGPLVLPMAYGHDNERLYLHGALANQLLGEGNDQEICATITCVDALVVARTPFHNSMNYRSVVIRGRAHKIADDTEKLTALKLITDHIAAIWDHQRPPSKTDLRKTLVLALPLTESSAKVRSGDPIDEPADLTGPWWAGVVPITTLFQTPQPAADLNNAPTPPESLTKLNTSTPPD